MNEPQENEGRRPLSSDELEALNKHGVFFKKRVLHELTKINGVSIICEELGVTFGGTRVIDILARDKTKKPCVFFVLECKCVYQKRWIFFRDADQRFRFARVQSKAGNFSRFLEKDTWPVPVVSEGFEFWEGDPARNKPPSADQDPIFKAASQLCAGYCGFIARRHSEFSRSGNQEDAQERYVPVLVTNAELMVLDSDFQEVNLETGKAPDGTGGRRVQELVMKHPFPTPEGINSDFRNFQIMPPPAGYWIQLHKESVYVVRADYLSEFFSPTCLDHFRTA